jgi:hypothetical protein
VCVCRQRVKNRSHSGRRLIRRQAVQMGRYFGLSCRGCFTNRAHHRPAVTQIITRSAGGILTVCRRLQDPQRRRRTEARLVRKPGTSIRLLCLCLCLCLCLLLPPAPPRTHCVQLLIRRQAVLMGRYFGFHVGAPIKPSMSMSGCSVNPWLALLSEHV